MLKISAALPPLINIEQGTARSTTPLWRANPFETKERDTRTRRFMSITKEGDLKSGRKEFTMAIVPRAAESEVAPEKLSGK
jgi:hypothetical protein